MFVYVLDVASAQFIETESLYPHDIALLIDNKTKQVYLWNGEKSKENERDMGAKMAKEIMEKYKSYTLVVLGDSTIPLKIQSEIDSLLGENANQERISRSKAMNVFTILGIIGFVIFLLVPLNNLRMLSWEMQETALVVNEFDFYDSFKISVYLAIAASVVFLAQLVCGLITQRIFLIVCAIASLIMALGSMLYLAQGEFIFEFQPSSDPSLYIIERKDVLIHVIWMFGMWFFITLSTGIGIFVIKKQTVIVLEEKVDVDQLRMSAKPTILRDKVQSVKEA
jgi:hypothetical protein